MKSFLTISAGSRLIRFAISATVMPSVYSNSFGNSWNLRSVTGLGAELPRLFYFFILFYSSYYFVDFSLGFDYSTYYFVCLGPSSFSRRLSRDLSDVPFYDVYLELCATGAGWSNRCWFGSWLSFSNCF